MATSKKDASGGFAAKAAKQPAPLSYLKKAQIIAGFDMAIDIGASRSLDYDGDFVLNAQIATTDKKQIAAFLAEEGIATHSEAGKTYIPAASYYALEAKYSVPAAKDEIIKTLRKFDVPGHTADFANSNSAFGLQYSRTIKLLREHGIEGKCQLMDGKATGGDQADRCTITLSQAGYEKLQRDMPKILEAEAARLSKHKARIAEESAPAAGVAAS